MMVTGDYDGGGDEVIGHKIFAWSFRLLSFLICKLILPIKGKLTHLGDKKKKKKKKHDLQHRCKPRL